MVWKDDVLFLSEWFCNYFLSLYGRSFCMLVIFSFLIFHSINWVKTLSKLQLIGLLQFCLVFHRQKYACVHCALHVRWLWSVQDLWVSLVQVDNVWLTQWGEFQSSRAGGQETAHIAVFSIQTKSVGRKIRETLTFWYLYI